MPITTSLFFQLSPVEGFSCLPGKPGRDQLHDTTLVVIQANFDKAAVLMGCSNLAFLREVVNRGLNVGFFFRGN